MTPKENALRAVLLKRIEGCDIAAKNAGDIILRNYYEGKAEGLLQAYELIGEKLGSIKIEIDY